VFRLGGLFAGVNDSPFSGTINVFAYAGNNTENISDYEAASTAWRLLRAAGYAACNAWREIPC